MHNPTDHASQSKLGISSYGEAFYMIKKAREAEVRRIQGEIGRLVEVGFLKSEQDPEGAILEAAIRILGGTFTSFTDTRPANKEIAEGMVECELPGF